MTTTRVVVEVSGDLRKMLEEQRDTLADAVRDAVHTAAENLQTDLRMQTRGAGLGPGLEKAWRLQKYPTGRRTTRPAGLVYSKATFLHDVFINGASMEGLMFVPTHQAMAMGYGQTNISRKGGTVPGGQLRRTAMVQRALALLGKKNIFQIPLPGGKALVLYRPPGRGKPIPMFVIIRQSTLAPRIDLEGAVQRASADLEARVSAALNVGLNAGG